MMKSKLKTVQTKLAHYDLMCPVTYQ